MSILRRLCDQRLRRILSNLQSSADITIKRFKNVQFERISSPKLPSHYDKKNECLKRPLAPHVTIYKMEFHMVGSLLHRTSGIMLSAFFLLFGMGTLLLPNDFQFYVDWIKDQDIPQWLITPAKWIIAFPLVWHSVGGVRHLIWDFGILLKNIKSVWGIGAASFIAGLVITTALAFIET